MGVDGNVPDRIVAQIRGWRDELIDLSRRNKLLNYKPTKASTLQITAPGAETVLGRLDGAGWRFHYPEPTEEERADTALIHALKAEDTELTDVLMPDELLVAGVSARDLSRILRSLHRKASGEFVDKGIRVLYLAAGLLRWSDADGEVLRSPLLMVPVSLDRSSPREPYRLVGTDEDWVLNPALAVKLEQDFGIVIDEPDGLTLPAALDAVRRATAQERAWEIEDHLVLATFSFHKEAMYRDLKDNEAAILSHPAVRALCGGGTDALGSDNFDPPAEEELDTVRPPEAAASILDADGTQRRCIAAALDGDSFVMHGPPGTGKSQTIANVIAELLAANKSVLFVSEKAAALDVVRKRLAGAGLGHYVLELHSHKATRKAVAASLGESLQSRPQASHALRRQDADAAKTAREQLSQYALAMNEVREPIGRSPQALIGRWMQLQDAPEAPVPDIDLDGLDATLLARARTAAERWSTAWGPVLRGEGFVWRDLRDPAAVNSRITALIQEISSTQDALRAVTGLATSLTDDAEDPPPTDIEDLGRVAALAELLVDRRAVPEAWLLADESTAAEITTLLEARKTSWAAHAQIEQDLVELGADVDVFPAGLHQQLEEVTGRLGGLVPPVDVVGAATSGQLEAAALDLDRRSEHSRRIREAATAIATELGIDVPNPTAGNARSIAEVARLGAAEHRPEPGWLDPLALDAARTAATVVRRMVEEHRRLAAEVATAYTPDVLRLDIEQLYEGPNDVSPKLSRLSSAGRAHRKKVKACTPDGKLTDEALALLPTVRKLQQTAAELRAAAPSASDALGPHYFQGTDTDLDALGAALDAAADILKLLGATFDRERLASGIGRPALDPRRLAQLGEQLTAELATWGAPLPALLGDCGPVLGRSLEDARAWFVAAAGDLHHLSTLLASSAAAGPEDDLDTARRGAALHADAHATALLLQSSRGADEVALGAGYTGPTTDWDELEAAWSWARRVRAALAQPPLDPERARRILSVPQLDRPIRLELDMVTKKLDGILGLFEPAYRASLEADADGSVEEIDGLLQALRDQAGEIEEWATYASARAELVAAGLGDLVSYCEVQAPQADRVPDAIERAVLASVIDRLLAGDARLRPVRSEERDAIVAEFQELDRSLVSHAAAKVIDACNARRPKNSLGEAAVIQREAAKKTRHRPIRRLMDDAGRAAQDLRPCFMMSPLTVSQFLPPTLRFDVVIFDEASQVRPCDAVNAIYRGSQLIVAGDQRQLPPTSFFSRSTDEGDDEWAEEDLEVYESILDLCRSSGEMPELPLRWHYRSRHESLITFSNREYYSGGLITYPSATTAGEDVGLELIQVPDGEYQRGASRDNPVEARKVVERVVYHASHHPDLSVGVVAFSEAQATRISYELEAARRDLALNDEWFAGDRLDGFFVKNLESVQGDERDIIIFSIGYGPDENRAFKLNFGPLNKAGGERRLNVAVTRAKQRVEIVSSVRAADFPVDPPNPGVRSLRRYLDFAERGMAALASDGASTAAEPESPFEEEVAAIVRELGYRVQLQVGEAGYRIDMAVLDPEFEGRYLLGIECDGAAYHSSLVARDRDRLRQQVLEGLGWRLHRIWGPAWYRGRAAEIERLKRVLAAAERGELPSTYADAGKRPTVTVEVEPIDIDAPPEWAALYRPVKLGYGYLGKDLTNARDAWAVQEALFKIVDGEAPISRDLCHRRLRDTFRVQRNTSTVKRSIDAVIRSLELRDQLRSTADGFLYRRPEHLARVRRGDADDEGTLRRVSDISAVELGEAFRRMVAESGSVDHDELTDRVSRLFGWKRRGADITAALDSTLRTLRQRGSIVLGPSGRYEIQHGKEG